jgi:hypothetical protein
MARKIILLLLVLPPITGAVFGGIVSYKVEGNGIFASTTLAVLCAGGVAFIEAYILTASITGGLELAKFID